MPRMIAARQGQIPSLADVEDFRLLARGMSALDAVELMLTDDTPGFDSVLEGVSNETDREQTRQRSLGSTPMLRPYQALASGLGFGAEGRYMALVLVHDNEAEAERNAELLRERLAVAHSFDTGRPWAEQIERVEILVQGRVLLAKLHGEAIALNWNEFRFFDPLLLHE